MMYSVVEWWYNLNAHLNAPPVFSGVRVTRSLVLYVCFIDRCLSFCTFFVWPLCCLFFFDIRILITPLVSSNSSCQLDIGTILQKNMSFIIWVSWWYNQQIKNSDDLKHVNWFENVVLKQLSGFLWVFQFRPPIKLTATI